MNDYEWQQECIYIDARMTDRKLENFNNDLACFHSYCVMQRDAATREGFHDSAQYIDHIVDDLKAALEPMGPPSLHDQGYEAYRETAGDPEERQPHSGCSHEQQLEWLRGWDSAQADAAEQAEEDRISDYADRRSFDPYADHDLWGRI